MKKFLFILLLVPFVVFGFVDPYARRLRPFSAVPGSCAENEIGYDMTNHLGKLCTNTGYQTILLSGGAGFVTSFNTRTGAVVPATNDYNFNQLAGSIAIGQIPNSLITYSKLILTGAILNADLAGSIAASKLIGSDIATVGTITSGTWNGTIINSTYGGTGVNNAGRTLTINTNSGTLAFGGTSKIMTFNKTMSFTAADDTGNYTFPTGIATLLATNGSGASLTNVVNSITGTSQQITASASTGAITLSLPTTLQWTSTANVFAVFGNGSAANFDFTATAAGTPQYNGNGAAIRISSDTSSNGSILFSTSKSGTGSAERLKIDNAGNLQLLAATFINVTTPSIAGNATLNTGSKDSAGKITSTTGGASTAVITFGTAFTRAPACVVTNETTANIVRPVSTTTTLTINATVVNGDSLSYICLGY
jgi:hypothetical protein